MFKAISTFRKRWAPTKTERREAGRAFAARHFSGYKTEDEFEMLYDGLPIDPQDPFDQGVMDFCRSEKWGVK